MWKKSVLTACVMYWRSRIMPEVICAKVQRRGNAEAPPHHALGSQIAMLRPELVDRIRTKRGRALTHKITHMHARARIGVRRLKRLAILFEAAPNQIRDAARWLVVPSWRTLTALCHLTHFSQAHTQHTELHHFHHYRRISLSFKWNNIPSHKRTHQRRPLIIEI